MKKSMGFCVVCYENECIWLLNPDNHKPCINTASASYWKVLRSLNCTTLLVQRVSFRCLHEKNM